MSTIFPITDTAPGATAFLVCEDATKPIHEAMHVVESAMVQNGAIRRRVNHAFIEGAAFGLATLLAGAGMTKVTPRQWRAAVARMRRRGDR